MNNFFECTLIHTLFLYQISYYQEDNNLFDALQSGFRKRHSTETALLKVSNDVLMAADSGQYTVLVLLDLTAAFDTVDHVIMIQRLQNDFGISGTVLEWLSSYFNGRTFSVLGNNYQSESKTLSCGVPQGSVLGPILFLLYLFPLGRLISLFGKSFVLMMSSYTVPFMSRRLGC